MATCCCACHVDSRIVLFAPPDVTDPIAAATACDSCRDAHCDTLLSRQNANDPEPMPCPEMSVWIDPPVEPSVDQGDGAE